MSNNGNGISKTPNYKNIKIMSSGNIGQWIPMLSMEYVPNETIKHIRVSLDARKLTALAPTMGKIIATTAVFSVSDLVLDPTLAKQYYGEQPGQYEPGKERPIRTRISRPVDYSLGNDTFKIGWKKGSLGDYLSYGRERTLPGTLTSYGDPESPLHLIDFVRYCKIWNEWFRNPNLQNEIDLAPAYVKDDLQAKLGKQPGSGKLDYITTASYGGNVAPACKRADRFTLCTPRKQQSNDIILPATGQAGVYTDTITNKNVANGIPLRLYNVENGASQPSGRILATGTDALVTADSSATISNTRNVVPGNLIAKMDGAGINISDFIDFYHQQLLENAINRLGSRYRQRNQVFGIQDRDLELQIPLLQAIQDTDIEMAQVIQNSATQSGGTPLGDVAGLSRTNGIFLDIDLDNFTPTTHGALMIIITFRVEQFYADGTPRHLLYETSDEQYNPMLANISDQPVYKGEIAPNLAIEERSGEKVLIDKSKETFGYMPAWDEYKHEPNRASGEMRAIEEGDLGTIYTYNMDVVNSSAKGLEAPSLNEDFVVQDVEQINHTLALDPTETGTHQFWWQGEIEIWEDLPMGSNQPGLNPWS